MHDNPSIHSEVSIHTHTSCPPWNYNWKYPILWLQSWIQCLNFKASPWATIQNIWELFRINSKIITSTHNLYLGSNISRTFQTCDKHLEKHMVKIVGTCHECIFVHSLIVSPKNHQKVSLPSQATCIKHLLVIHSYNLSLTY